MNRDCVVTNPDAPPHKRFRDQPSQSKSKCYDCPSACCRMITTAVTEGRILDPREVSNIRFYLMHENVIVSCAQDCWEIGFLTPCRFITVEQGLYKCSIWSERPQICRDHDPESCSEKAWFLRGERPEGELAFETIEDFDQWLAVNQNALVPFEKLSPTEQDHWNQEYL